MLPPTFFSNNRRALQKRLPDDSLVVMCANGLVQRSGDTTFPFRQESNFYYLTGLAEISEVVLVMEGSEEFLILPKRSEAENIFGGVIDCDEVAKISGITTILGYKEGWNRYKKLQKSRNKLYTLGVPPAKVTHTDAFYTNPARRFLVQKLKRIDSSVSIQDIRTDLTVLRQIKQPEEITAIKKAITITNTGFSRARKAMVPGMSEQALRAEFDYEFSKQGVPHAYEPIVAYDEKAVIVHNIGSTNSQLQEGSWALVDAGAEYAGYSADITRMLPLGKVQPRQREVYEAVERVLHACINELRPGLNFLDYARWAQQQVGQELVHLGLSKTASDKKAIRRYFPHLVSHSLGLDTHDVFNYHEVTLQENMVITVEPGIYIPEEGIGVRIEDDILITKTGAINLSKDIQY